MIMRKRTVPKAAKGEALSRPGPSLCPMCREYLRPLGELRCERCEAHNMRCLAVCRRVNAGRKVDRLAPVEERGRDLRRGV